MIRQARMLHFVVSLSQRNAAGACRPCFYSAIIFQFQPLALLVCFFEQLKSAALTKHQKRLEKNAGIFTFFATGAFFLGEIIVVSEKIFSLSHGFIFCFEFQNLSFRTENCAGFLIGQFKKIIIKNLKKGMPISEDFAGDQ